MREDTLQELELINDIRDAVTDRMNSTEFKVFIRDITHQITRDLKVEPHALLRRDHDGISTAEFLIEKMIGEVLSTGRINL